MSGRGAGWWLTGAAVVAGAFVLCAGIPLGAVYLVAHLRLGFLAELAIGGIGGLGAMVALAVLLGRVQALHVRLGPPPPPGLERGSVLLEASLVAAVLVTVAGIAIWLAFGSHGGDLAPLPG